VAIPIPPA